MTHVYCNKSQTNRVRRCQQICPRTPGVQGKHEIDRNPSAYRLSRAATERACTGGVAPDAIDAGDARRILGAKYGLKTGPRGSK